MSNFVFNAPDLLEAHRNKRKHELVLDGQAKITDIDGSGPFSDNVIKTAISNNYEVQKQSVKTRVRINAWYRRSFCHRLFSLTYDAFLLNINFPSQAIAKRMKVQEARLKTAELVLEFVKKESVVLADGGTSDEKAAVNKLQSDLQDYIKFEQGNVAFNKSEQKKSPFLQMCKKLSEYFNFSTEKFAKF